MNDSVNNKIEAHIKTLSNMGELLDYFEIGFDNSFLTKYGDKLFKRFNGNVILAEPETWFEYRRALKNAYCKIQRSRLDPKSRSACRGCTSCERR